MFENVFIFLSCLFVGFLSYFAGRWHQKRIAKLDYPVEVGTIVVETSDPDGPFLFLNLDVPVDFIGTHKKVICKVDTNGVVNDSRD